MGPGDASGAPFPIAAPIPAPVTAGSKRSASRRKLLAEMLAAILVIAALAGIGYYAVGLGGAKPTATPLPTATPTPMPTATPTPTAYPDSDADIGFRDASRSHACGRCD